MTFRLPVSINKMNSRQQPANNTHACTMIYIGSTATTEGGMTPTSSLCGILAVSEVPSSRTHDYYNNSESFVGKARLTHDAHLVAPVVGVIHH